jgi:hypothetical protein
MTFYKEKKVVLIEQYKEKNCDNFNYFLLYWNNSIFYVFDQMEIRR